MNNLVISKRAQLLLKNLVELYLRDGTPVGSKTLTQEGHTPLSSATVRKVLGDLEDQGYLLSPHTSSGRIPTSMGIRFFVDHLQTFYPLDEIDLSAYQAKLDKNKSTDDLLSAASTVLSELTHMVGVVTLPKREQLILKHLEFLPLSDKRILLILVLNEREVQNRILVLDRIYTQLELSQISQYLNQHFVGKDLNIARRDLWTDLQNDKHRLDRLMQAVVDIAGEVLKPPKQEPDYILAGQQHLLSHPQTVNMSQLKRLFDAFTEKQQMLDILDRCIQSEGVQLYIGEESGYDAFSDYSIVTSRYSVDGKLVGVLGVVGPTRMPYTKIIPIVEFTAKLLSTALDPGQ